MVKRSLNALSVVNDLVLKELSQHIRELCSPEGTDKEYNCDHCPAGHFKVKRYLQTHLKMCPDNPNRPPAMQCTICGENKWFFIGDLN